MRISPLAISIAGLLIAFFSFSCKQKLNNQNDYNANKDTIPPVLAITVPVHLDNYSYGEDIHVVGTATDLESKNPISVKTGKLSSLSLIINIIDPIADTIIGNPIMYKTPNVGGKDGFTFNEKTIVLFGSGTTYCRLKGVLTDQAGRKDSTILNFTIN